MKDNIMKKKVNGKVYTIETFPVMTKLYNAIGTSKAMVQVGEKWENPLDAWKNIIGKDELPEYCPNGISCAWLLNGKGRIDDFVGAHVVKSDPEGKEIKKGDTYYIVPLCAGCNDKKENLEIELIESVKGLKLEWTGKEKHHSK